MLLQLPVLLLTHRPPLMLWWAMSPMLLEMCVLASSLKSQRKYVWRQMVGLWHVTERKLVPTQLVKLRLPWVLLASMAVTTLLLPPGLDPCVALVLDLRLAWASLLRLTQPFPPIPPLLVLFQVHLPVRIEIQTLGLTEFAFVWTTL